ncbi:MAG: 50S ribosomal protein L11 methyltransferase [Planctomycetota bacterium]|jgi:ribosomal protein L11 methyltransferase|nr:50S ribosomal protein L11 methyltransferase [Planctomycetota bacterium]
MDYLVRHLIVNAGDEAALSTVFLSAGFTGFVFASRQDGRLDCSCYGGDGMLPPVVDAVMGQFAVVLVGEERRSEAELLAGALDEDPCELRSGVWIDPKGTLDEQADRMVLRIPPSAAFGDGRHPTTRMAASLFAPQDVRGKSVCDLGCGTGVLGILAQRWGARRVVMSDLDADAVRTAAQVAAANGAEAITVLASDLLDQIPAEPVDLLLANIYGDLCQRLMTDPKLDAVLPHGVLVLSGISYQRKAAVVAAVEAAGFEILAEREEAWWCALRCWR